jgi:uncharacterized protein (DUF1810 family)
MDSVSPERQNEPKEVGDVTGAGQKSGNYNRGVNDRYDLQRFVDAQELGSSFEQARAELAAGRKRSHWIWFIFPQIQGLGSSAMSQHYAISGPEESKAYLLHPVLGPRLRECTALVNDLSGRSVAEIFGSPDDLKFHSSVTLFAWAASHERTAGNEVFSKALGKYFAGKPDQATIDRLPGG